MALEPIKNNGTFAGFLTPNFKLPQLTYSQNLGLNNTAATAKATGNQLLAQILGYVKDYGLPIIETFGKIGIIKNKNAQTFTPESFDLAAYQKAIADGQLSSAVSGLTPTTPQNSAKFLGLDFTNPFTWVGVLIFIFAIGYVIKQVKSEPEPTVKTRRR